MKRNVLLLFSDQHRGDWLPQSLENIHGLMENGVCFDNCVTPSPLCAPARACLALGRNYDNCGTYNNGFCMPLDRPTVYSAVKSKGYLVGNSGKLDLHKPCLFWNEDGWLSQLDKIGFTDAVDNEGKWDTLWASYYETHGPYGGFLRRNNLMDEYAKDYLKRFFNPMTVEPTSLPDWAYSDNFVTDNALKILDKFTSSGKPWFMHVNFSGPHDPWDITVSMKKLAETEKLNFVERNYLAMLKNIDRNIGRIISFVKEKGQLDNTLVIYSADHGEMLGDRGMYYKSKPYRASIHVPLIIRGEGLLKNHTVSEPVQLEDVTATILQWCGAELQNTDGVSLLDSAADLYSKPVRTHQISKLSKSIKSKNSFKGYEQYSIYEKTMTDREFFGKICNDQGIDMPDIPAVNNEIIPDWACLIAEGHKLILYSDGRHEMYETSDMMEERNIYDKKKEYAGKIEKQYGLKIFEQGDVE